MESFQLARSEERILDEFLVASARVGDRTALDALARRWEKRLVRHAWRLLGDGELARDVAQEAWVHIARAIPRLDDGAAFPAFALRIVTRRAADAIRGARRRRAGMAAFAADHAQTEDRRETLEATASGASLSAALATLPAEQRAAVALFYLEDLSVADMAVALGVPAGTVKTRLMAAREKLRLALGVDKEEQHEPV
jgi:RNA polymerase sigma-70 factor (ECF subfamily)